MKISRLLLMSGLHFVTMYLLMYSMVNRIGYVYPNINNLYMAGIMTAPMLVYEIMLMGSMYGNKKALRAIMVTSIIVFVLFFLGIRKQTLVNDNEFLRSMIPHHSGAILMCREADIANDEIRNLCGQIIRSQQEEIDLMQSFL